MNYPEELREKFNECMFDERDLIMNFLNDTADLSRGNQMFEWTLVSMPKLLGHDGKMYEVRKVALDPNKFVTFLTTSGGCKSVWRECTFFAYGELSKVIEALPNAEDVVWNNAVNDLKVMTTNLRIDNLLADAPFKYEVGSKHYVVDDVKCVNGTLSLVQALGNDTPVSDLPLEVLVNLRDHINIEVLHRSNEYKELMELLSLEENMRFECQNYGDVTFVISGTDVTFDISSVRRNDNGGLVIYGNDIDADVCDNIELTEKDIKHEYLVGIINEIKRSKYSDIMDAHNAHSPELVRKINAAWKSPKYHDLFGDILFALARRDEEEIGEKYGDLNMAIQSPEEAMSYAHEILEGVCDDWDLETILSFIRYKED